MRKLLGTLSIVIGLFLILYIFFGISFASNIVDTILLVAFGSSTTIYFALISSNIRTQVLLVGVLIFIAISYWFVWLLFGYESRIDKSWNVGHYNIQLQHRLEIAGPGNFWFLVNRRLLNGLLEKRLETRKYGADLPNPPETFTFVNSGDTLRIQCCENNLIIIPDTIAYKEYLKTIKGNKKR